MAALDHRLRPAAGEPEGLIVLIHGRGSDENDLFGLFDAIDPGRRYLGATPGGPLSLPPGGRHWYVLGGLGTPDPASYAPSFDLLVQFIDELAAEHGLPPEKVVLGGFSQGCVMTWGLGAAAGRPAPAGLICLSGFMPEVPTRPLDLPARAGLPVLIGHGLYDPVIPVEYGIDARARAEAAGLDVTWREAPMAHTIDPRLLQELPGWIERALG